MNRPKAQMRQRPPRIEIPPVQIACLDFQSGNSGIVLDVSCDGLGFRALEPLEKNAPVPFRLSVPGFRQLNLYGQIAWLDDTKKRGGLRVIVPRAERQLFQLWQQRYLTSQTESGSRVSTRGRTDVTGGAPADAKDSHIQRNVLAGCLVFALCLAITGRSYVLATTHRFGNLLTHVVQNIASRNPRTSAAAAPQQVTPPQHPQAADRRNVTSRAPQSRTALEQHPNRLHAQLTASPDSSSAVGGLRFREAPVDMATTTAAPSANLPSAADREINIPAATVAHTPSKEVTIPRTASRARNHRLTRSRSQTRPKNSALALSTASPRAPATVPSSRRIPAKPRGNLTSNSTAPAHPSDPLAFAAKPSKALDTQLPAPTATLDPCRLVRSVEPTYPTEARAKGVQGDVKLRVVVGTSGNVESVASLSGPPLLIPAAVDATRQFLYKPALLNGNPIKSIQTVDISFKLRR
jgi:TonB family protein